jgi:NDP-sugar pyrophosphorylase family protein
MFHVDAIVLAGGRGTRLQPVVRDVPKVLAPVNGRPFLDILLDFLDHSGCVGRIVLALGYKSDLVVEHVRAGKPRNIPVKFSIETGPLGTGGAARYALAETESNPVLVLNGDSYIDLDINGLLAVQRERKHGITVAVRPVGNAKRYGGVSLAEYDRIRAFDEKSNTAGAGHINAGIYACDRQTLMSIPEDRPISIERDVFPRLAGNNELYAYLCEGRFIDIGVPSSYRAAQAFFSPDP